MSLGSWVQENVPYSPLGFDVYFEFWAPLEKKFTKNSSQLGMEVESWSCKPKAHSLPTVLFIQKKLNKCREPWDWNPMRF
uniref:Uncharacterized protein n=1 Tax=Nelumbo nucifera TaxID=4432 RepID=A0A822YGS0_NELNU|nr:TPA_asm: hypothetical protein HUJ06_010548 [Nelumbo nucifera]